MINISGVYECKVDAKGRFPFPAALKKQLADHLSEGFFMKRSIFHRYVELYPMNIWQMEDAKLRKLNDFKSKNVDFIRKLLAFSRNVELDPAGRILISKELLEYAGISKDIVVAASLKKIEIWDKAAYNNSIIFDPEDFAKEAEDIMSDEVYKDNI